MPAETTPRATKAAIFSGLRRFGFRLSWSAFQVTNPRSAFLLLKMVTLGG